MADIQKSEKAIKERIGIGMSVPERTLVAELKERGVQEGAVRKAISVMSVPAAPRPWSLSTAVADHMLSLIVNAEHSKLDA